MTDDDLPPRYTRLIFHGPLSEARAGRLVERLARTRPVTVLDLGCGWGELLLRILDAVPDAVGADLAGLVDVAISAGFRPEWIEAASLEEWDDFESGVAADVEEWLAGHPDHPRAAEIRKKADDRLSIWLRGSRGCFGLAYLTLIPLP